VTTAADYMRVFFTDCLMNAVTASTYCVQDVEIDRVFRVVL